MFSGQVENEFCEPNTIIISNMTGYTSFCGNLTEAITVDANCTNFFLDEVRTCKNEFELDVNRLKLPGLNPPEEDIIGIINGNLLPKIYIPIKYSIT